MYAEFQRAYTRTVYLFILPSHKIACTNALLHTIPSSPRYRTKSIAADWSRPPFGYRPTSHTYSLIFRDEATKQKDTSLNSPERAYRSEHPLISHHFQTQNTKASCDALPSNLYSLALPASVLGPPRTLCSVCACRHSLFASLRMSCAFRLGA